MSWRELVADAGWTMTVSPTESDRFGRTIARLVVPRDAPVSARDVTSAVARSAADIVIVRYAEGRTDLPAVFGATGWTVLSGGSLVYWGLKVGTGRRPIALPGLEAGVLCADDGVALIDEVVADSFADYSNHYAANPLLPADAAAAGYQDWARRSFEHAGTVVLALREDGNGVGVATCVSADDHVEILLAGLVARVQRQGWYAHLLSAVELHAAVVGAGQVVISTQAHHSRVQRAWARYGFEPMGAVQTLHLVRPGLIGPGADHPSRQTVPVTA